VTRRLLVAAALLILAGCEHPPKLVHPNIVLPFENRLDVHTSTQRDLTFIPPTDPRYAENGAPRAGAITGGSIAGDPDQVGVGKSYAPIPSGR
jgi:hypothetical protein